MDSLKPGVMVRQIGESKWDAAKGMLKSSPNTIQLVSSYLYKWIVQILLQIMERATVHVLERSFGPERYLRYTITISEKSGDRMIWRTRKIWDNGFCSIRRQWREYIQKKRMVFYKFVNKNIYIENLNLNIFYMIDQSLKGFITRLFSASQVANNMRY